MALELPYGGKNLNPNGSSNFDESYGYYNSLEEAYVAVPLAMRKGGRTVGIKQADGSIVEYWWANDNDLSDSGLVEKNVGGGGGGLDLKIGGRNYLPNFYNPEWNIDSGAVVDRYSLHFPANSGNPTAEIILDVESNTNYTFTFNSDYARYSIREYNGGVGDIIFSGSEPETTFNTGSFTKIRLSIDTGSGNRDKDRNVSYIKLEKGNIATDWTPNPKDKANKDEIPDEFVPSDHDLEEFKNQSANPFARMGDVPPPFDPTYLEYGIEELKIEKQDILGFTPEDVDNKAESLTDPNNTTYPTTKAVADAIYLTDVILSANAVLSENWNGRDIITAGYSLTVNPNTQDYKDSFEVYLYNNSATDSAIVLNAKAGVTYTVIDNDVSSATVYLQAYGTAVIKRIGNTQNFIVRGYII